MNESNIYRRSDYVVQVGEKEVFTKEYSFDQYQRLLCIIDRVEAIAATALALAIIALITALAG